MHNFAHLHVHSHFSLLAGTAGVSELAARAAADGMTHLALTDHNVMYGAAAFDRACRSHGVQPILGMSVSAGPPDEELMADAGATGRLVLLATGPEGYRSLSRLSSLIQAAPDRAAAGDEGLGWEILKSHRKGLICLSGGRRGWIERLLRAGDGTAAQRYAARLAAIYGENTFLSLELHHPQDAEIGREMQAIGQRLGLSTVAVQPVYCLSMEDTPTLRLLAAIDRNQPLENVPPEKLPDGGDPAVALHWLSPDEVALRYTATPGAVAAVAEVTMRCKRALPSGKPIWPALDLPQGKSPDEALEDMAQAGLLARYRPDPPEGASVRLGKELATIAAHGYAPLFLVVADIVRFAREAGVPTSTRGSVANSLAAYCVGITSVDPLAHDLLFERFLSPARSDPPDIDLDLCSRGRDRVLEYVRRTFGAERMALVGSISTMRRRSAVREVAKAYGLDEAEIGALMSALPAGWLSTRQRDLSLTLQDVATALESPRWRRIIRAADRVTGLPHHFSLHPGGVVITPGPVTDVVPTQRTPKGFLATQLGHKEVEALGLPKIDLLGVRALTVLADAAALVQRRFDPALRLDGIPLDDPRTAELLERAETIGVFQCESLGARRTLRQLRARDVRDLAVANAFFKPGPAMGGMARQFIRRYRGEQPVSYLHPALAPILEGTKGVLIFQEQILRVAREVAGLSWDEADQLRRGIKFDPQAMSQVRERFVPGCQGTAGMTREQAEILWEQVLAFSGYGFNQGHATAYADVSYRSAFLKVHWPAAFMAARLAQRGGFHHPAIYIAEATRMGMRVRPPHVNHSGVRFTLGAPVGPDATSHRFTLWMGLGQVRALRRASVRRVVADRRWRPFSDLRDLMRRVPLQSKEITNLIQGGGLDGMGDSRAALLVEAQEILRSGSALQMAFPFAQPQTFAETAGQRLAWERRVLGQPVSVHPLELVADRLPEHLPLSHLPDRPVRRVTVAGARLPGWTGGQGFFLGDGETFVVVKGVDRTPPAWHPLLLQGRWTADEWGMFWLQAEEIAPQRE
jgi:DNA polymerase-3 subunit alpha